MIGDSGLSKHEADVWHRTSLIMMYLHVMQMLQDGLNKALEKFDRERVLAAWDALISKQQAILSEHKVPAMYPTSQSADREVFQSNSWVNTMS